MEIVCRAEWPPPPRRCGALDFAKRETAAMLAVMDATPRRPYAADTYDQSKHDKGDPGRRFPHVTVLPCAGKCSVKEQRSYAAAES